MGFITWGCVPTPASVAYGFKAGVTEAAELGAVVGYGFKRVRRLLR